MFLVMIEALQGPLDLKLKDSNAEGSLPALGRCCQAHRLQAWFTRLFERDWEAFKTKHLTIVVGVLVVRKLNG